MIVPAHSIAIGYHGCDRKVGESLLAGESSIRFGENSYDGLGHGAYFWESDLTSGAARRLGASPLLRRFMNRPCTANGALLHRMLRLMPS